ncbi:hypothetical protein [Fibrella aquatilis]|uniref:Uncharacterized protein n=1 Tax=Fibrella aquatilis TaxID=2817059 RepID=A0A939G858_9BACT|nr:hypothetical protein [Fibrella aquatilis]MBO0932399.1 hypothetical protein [Fibrella aquatilis]
MKTSYSLVKQRFWRSTFAWVFLAICTMRAGCGPRDCGTIETDIRRLIVTLLTNGGGTPQSLPPGATVLANAFAIEISVRDSVVRTIGGSGACDNIQPRRTVTALAVSSLPGTSATKVPVGGQLYVKQGQKLPVLLSDFLKANQPLFPQTLLLLSYGELPVYGRQRWLVEATLSDNTLLQVTTPDIILVR